MIQVENLTRVHGERIAVDDISFRVDKGEIVGFLGPNAAGKTTTMRMITGYLKPSGGDIRLGDCDMVSEPLEGRRLLGYLPETVPLYSDMTVRAYLGFAARLRGLDRKAARRRVEVAIETCRLEAYADARIGKLSKGYRQRVGLAQATVHEPEVLILDEPTVGIDPIQVSETRQLIRELGRSRTVLLSTHILSEVSAICERVIVIHRGRIVAEDRIETLSMLLSSGRLLRLEIEGPVAAIRSRLERTDGVRKVDHDPPSFLVEYAPDSDPRARITAEIVRNGWTLLSMEAVEMSLEEIFLELTRGDGTGEARPATAPPA